MQIVIYCNVRPRLFIAHLNEICLLHETLCFDLNCFVRISSVGIIYVYLQECMYQPQLFTYRNLNRYNNNNMLLATAQKHK